MSRFAVINLKSTLKPAFNLSTLTDVELLKLLCSSEDDAEPYNEFVKRFYNEVHTECQLICAKRKLNKQIGTDIAGDTFERVRKYKSFKQDEIRVSDNKKAILVYLYRFVRNQFSDYHTKLKKADVVYRAYFEDIACAVHESIDIADLKRKKELSEKILKKLNQKEKRVLLTDIEYKRHQKYLPEDVLENLAEELEVKKETIRKIRERVIEKINKAIDEINKS